MAFIETLEYQFDINKIREILDKYSHIDQVTLNNRGDVRDPQKQLTCGSGGLQNYYEIRSYDDIKGKDFYWRYLNDLFRGTVIEDLYDEVSKDFMIGRSRFMSLKPGSCYSYHHDFSKRLHIPIVTNEYCQFFDKDWNTYHLEVGKSYIVDTTQKHTAGNFGKETRTHIVMAIQ